jgi:hypothetical protein
MNEENRDWCVEIKLPPTSYANLLKDKEWTYNNGSTPQPINPGGKKITLWFKTPTGLQFKTMELPKVPDNCVIHCGVQYTITITDLPEGVTLF